MLGEVWGDPNPILVSTAEPERLVTLWWGLSEPTLSPAGGFVNPLNT
jgi:hypothetical protein